MSEPRTGERRRPDAVDNPLLTPPPRETAKTAVELGETLFGVSHGITFRKSFTDKDLLINETLRHRSKVSQSVSFCLTPLRPGSPGGLARVASGSLAFTPAVEA
jgi:hypothetical protein